MFHGFRCPIRVGTISLCLLASVGGHSQTTITNDPPFYGPFNAVFLPDGDGLKKPLRKDDSVVRADSPWSLSCWVKSAEPPKGPSLVAGIGDPAEEFSRYLAFDAEHATLWMGKDNSLSGPASLAAGKWHFLAATFDGEEFRLYSDGLQIAISKLDLGSVSPVLQIAPVFVPDANWHHFGGTVAGLSLVRRALSAEEVKQLSQSPEDLSLIEYEEGSKPWPVQTRGQAGYRAPQDPATMPRSNAPFSRPVAKKLPAAQEALEANGEGEWTLAGGWWMTPAPKVNAD
ncbi:MAG: LamG domain-containing protein, partial [Candidatus Sulfotelmatobacter sp.]